MKIDDREMWYAEVMFSQPELPKKASCARFLLVACWRGCISKILNNIATATRRKTVQDRLGIKKWRGVHTKERPLKRTNSGLKINYHSGYSLGIIPAAKTGAESLRLDDRHVV